MYIVIRTIEIANGADAAKAVEMAMKMANYVTEKQGMKTKLVRNVGGELNKLHWMVMTDSLDAGPARDMERNNDPEFQQLFAEAQEAQLFTPGSASDTIYHVLG